MKKINTEIKRIFFVLVNFCSMSGLVHSLHRMHHKPSVSNLFYFFLKCYLPGIIRMLLSSRTLEFSHSTPAQRVFVENFLNNHAERLKDGKHSNDLVGNGAWSPNQNRPLACFHLVVVIE
eukprot:c19843_g1_i3.p1 GENE.c19843_g1_i3~~c19843_g1_i3.p1  ORF type:complete len:120 (+),score=12.65 c19843_g1_i3:349-708(+)